MLSNEVVTFESSGGKVSFTSRAGASYFVGPDGISGLDGLRNEIYKDQSAGQDGSTATGEALLERAITLQGVINGSQDYLDRRLQQVFNPKTGGGTLTYESGSRKRKIFCKIEQAPTITRDWRRKFFISLLATDPYFEEGAGETRTDVAAWLPLFEFDFDIPADGFEIEVRQVSQVMNVANPGDVDTGMRVVFRANGTVVNPEIMNVETYAYIRLNLVMEHGSSVEVNTRARQKGVWLIHPDSSRENIFHLRAEGMTFFALGTGDNLLRYDAAEGLDNLSCEVYRVARYVSA